MSKDFYQLYILTGLYFGYPVCCIHNFLERNEEDDYYLTPEQEKVHAMTGFCPCHSHAVYLLERGLPAIVLIKDRVCKQPFPVDTDREELENFRFGMDKHKAKLVYEVLKTYKPKSLKERMYESTIINSPRFVANQLRKHQIKVRLS